MTRGVAFWRKLYFDLALEVEQVLGKALGYPKYMDDQKNFPGATEADGVCTGEHVPESILSEAARVLGFSKTPKPLVFDESCNVPCTAGLEVELEKLASYFEKRARENTKRSDKLDTSAMTKFNPWNEYEQKVSSYYFSGKADTYTRAAEKVRELLGVPAPKTAPEKKYIVEMYNRITQEWHQSRDMGLVYNSLGEAKDAMERHYRAYGKNRPYRITEVQ